jgi:cell pole-organizing protein PopZ
LLKTKPRLTSPDGRRACRKSEASADAARQSLEALTAAVAPAVAAARRGPAVGGRSMEDVVLDALRPMLKEWLDANLPALVEAMVAKEISRITGKRALTSLPNLPADSARSPAAAAP